MHNISLHLKKHDFINDLPQRKGANNTISFRESKR